MALLVNTRRFPPRRFHAITLFPFVFYNGERLNEREVRHETVHLWQQAALLLVGFGLHDSITEVAKRQYVEIFRNTARVALDTAVSEEKREALSREWHLKRLSREEKIRLIEKAGLKRNEAGM